MVGATECRDRSALSSHLVGPTARVLARDDGPASSLLSGAPHLSSTQKKGRDFEAPTHPPCPLDAGRVALEDTFGHQHLITGQTPSLLVALVIRLRHYWTSRLDLTRRPLRWVHRVKADKQENRTAETEGQVSLFPSSDRPPAGRCLPKFRSPQKLLAGGTALA
jgi:hypothetical protein